MFCLLRFINQSLMCIQRTRASTAKLITINTPKAIDSMILAALIFVLFFMGLLIFLQDEFLQIHHRPYLYGRTVNGSDSVGLDLEWWVYRVKQIMKIS